MNFNLRSFLFGSSLATDTSTNIVYTLFRFYTGISMALGAGWPKMQDGMAPDWFVQQVSEIGFHFPSPAFWATLASWGEFVGGLCIALGLLTRLSALQLAFQFFVVAFLWYKEPFPLLGMYYQQLLFWAFLLIGWMGGGRISLDYWISQRRPASLPLKTSGSLAMLLLVCSVNSWAQSGHKPEPNVFIPYIGKWQGTLTYLDYQSNQHVSIAVSIQLQPLAGTSNQAVVEVQFPGEAGHDYTDTLLYTASEKNVGSASLHWVTEKAGQDDNLPAQIRETYNLQPKEIKYKYEVRWSERSTFFTRNEYVLHKTQ